MDTLLSLVTSWVSPSFQVFWLHSRGPHDLRDMTEAGHLADADGIGFVGSAVGVRTVVDGGSVHVSVETWSGVPSRLGDDPPADVSADGVLTFPEDTWCIDESQDSSARSGLPLPAGAGTYGVRVMGYNRTAVADRIRHHGADIVAAMEEVSGLTANAAERYRIQMWPVRRPR
jgi:hypothetical protein